MNRTKKLFSFFISCIFAGLIVEGFFVLVYYVKQGGHYVPAQRIIQMSGPRASWRTTEYNCHTLITEVSHPFLAFSTLAKPYCPQYEDNSGHTGHVFPRKANPDKFVVLFTGASIPVQLLEKATPTFGQMLSQQYRYQGKEIEVLPGAVIGWKMPQQYILLMLNTHVIDAVVSLEGFNELVAAFKDEYRFDFGTPSVTALKRTNPALVSKELLLLSWLYEKSFDFVQQGHVLKHLKTTAFFLQGFKRWVNEYADTHDGRGGFRQLIKPFELPKSWSFEERQQRHLDMYKRYIRNMNNLAQTNSIKFALFLQPVPLIGKTLSPEERTVLEGGGVFGKVNYGENYAEMQKSLLELRSEGISIFSLENVFIDYKDTVYKDGIHLDLEKQGPQILNQAIIDVLATQWGLEKKFGAK